MQIFYKETKHSETKNFFLYNCKCQEKVFILKSEYTFTIFVITLKKVVKK